MLSPRLPTIGAVLMIVTFAAEPVRTQSSASPSHARPSRRCSQKLAALVEHRLSADLVRPPEHRWRDRQVERLGGLEIDDQLELRRLLDGQVGGFSALEDLVHIGGRATK